MLNSSRQARITATLLLISLVTSGCLPSESKTAVDVDNTPPSTDVDNSPPSIAGTPATTATIGAMWSFTPTSSDPDDDSLAYSISNRPIWATFDTDTGEIRGMPDVGDIGMYSNIVISVSDGQAISSLQPFAIEVVASAPSNNPPTISGNGSATIAVGDQYSFEPTANDPDGDTLEFSITNRPIWLIFDPATGRLSGTPDVPDIGVHGAVEISVSDGELSAALRPFDITVVEAENSTPEISGDPPTSVTADSAYSFTPTASDPDGDNLTFSITGMPGWAEFDEATGTLSGTPDGSAVGTYSDIVISVSDGELTDALPAFSIEVAETAMGSVRLSWTPPTQNSDGSGLTDLIAYKFYYGPSADDLPNVIRIENPGLSSYVIDNLPPNTYYFVTTVVNSQEVESEHSNVTSITISSN